MYGMIKVAALSPQTTVANPMKNEAAARVLLREAANNGVQLAVLPELFLSGYTCADLFFQDTLLQESEAALARLLNGMSDTRMIYAVGLPIAVGSRLYNCAAVCQGGNLLGVVPKQYLPNHHEFYEQRWFQSGAEVSEREITLCGRKVPFGEQLFRFGDLLLGVELCEDLWVPVPPSSSLALAGANVIVNLSASNELVSKNDYRRQLVVQQSACCICGYLFASAGIGESTTDVVFSGDCLIAENGTLLSAGVRFSETGQATACIDLERLMSERRMNTSFGENARVYGATALPIWEGQLPDLPETQIDRSFDPHPFIPADPKQRDERCREILNIQSVGLARRLAHTGLSRAVIGISGGLDSTLALLVAVEAMKRLQLPTTNILCVTMPGFGTTDQTYQNALELVASTGAELREISIRESCLLHMQDIGHDSSIHDITYENAQARERTQILMDLANKYGGILVGTGDLSELAMGWCTYNGDHMSMYGVNASVPKTLVRHLVDNYALHCDERMALVLRRVLDTPVSPELLPPDEAGNIQQKTEEQIGPYELHDFFLYYFLRFGFSPKKLQFLAERAFAGTYDRKTVNHWLRLFLRRFFISQFKRSCMPDGPKVGSVGLSPRGDWRMPSDADAERWLAECDEISL